MDTTFRKLTASDIDTCLSIMMENYPREEDKHWQALIQTDLAEVVAQKYPSECLLVLCEGIAVGFGCSIKNSESPAIYALTWINILPSYQGRGIGKALIRELEKNIISQNKGRLTIMLQTDKPAFYTKLGYKTASMGNGKDVMSRKFSL